MRGDQQTRITFTMMSMAQQQHTMCAINNSMQQQLSCPALSIPKPELGFSPGGSLTSPGNSCSSSGTLLSSPHCSPEVTTAACGQQQDMGMLAAAGHFAGGREWLYRLVTFPAYFTPCVGCCGGSRAPKREQLMTLFDTCSPYQVYCSHCPEVKGRPEGTLLQVRRSAFKDVVKATDIARFGCCVAGVQQYTLNGSKVIYLNREQAPERKGSGASSAPAQCSVDGRAMMDKSSQYCSLKCKMHAEDPGFNTWLDTQDPSVRILAQAAADAPPRPTAACKRANPCSSACSSENASAATDAPGSAASSGSRPAKKPARAASGSVSSAEAAAAAAAIPAAVTMDMPGYGAPCMSMGMGSRVMVAPPGAGSYMQTPHQAQQQQTIPGMQRAASACLPGSSTAAAPSGLRRVRISLAGQPRQQSAPSAFSLEAALADPLLQPAAAAAAAGLPAGMVCGKDCLLPCCNEDMFSLSGSWDSALDSALSSPSQLAGLEDLEDLEAWASSGAEDDGCCMSPALINAPRSAFGSASSSAGEWWLPAAGPFAEAGMGALVVGGADGGDGGLLGDAEDDAVLLLPGSGSGSGYECCDMVMSLLAAESLSGAALMLH
ncbi:hypothetical protein OEZ85_008503 [Tetradesmus obliquus]|uniref:SREBP regulating gene protein n=1 Tax=Tetradesmus obliquus TaxID=3088 RepID=A0ABY8TJB1_TETOB|nr:hypothetical protein OEZ85_008503 [Tetradesmus obliquus]